jgi:hypothetical protein
MDAGHCRGIRKTYEESLMPGIRGLVNYISNQVVSNLALANYPPLVDGAILIGKQYIREQSAPPRIVFVPIGSTFGADDVYDGTGTYLTGQTLNRSIETDFTQFEVHCWGCALTNDTNDSYDYDGYDMTQLLYQEVIRTCDFLMRGNCTWSRGQWTTGTQNSPALLDRDGQEFVFILTVGTPVPEKVIPLVYAPSNVKGGITTIMQLPDGTNSIGCQD